MHLPRTASLIVAVVALLAFAGPAAATNRFVLDPTPASNGNVVQDAGGTAYVAWAHNAGGSNPAVAMFCRIPRGATCTSPVSLALPGGSGLDGVSGAFPVLGAGTVVYVVAPRYVRNDVVVYTSNTGGQSFDAGVVQAAGAYSNKSNPTDVIRTSSQFLVAAYNPSLGFSTFGAATGAFEFNNVGAGGVQGSTMALDGSGRPVQAYWNQSTPYSVLFYRGTGALTTQAGWAGPTAVAAGVEPRLAGGRSGLLLVTQDLASASAPYPSVLNVRKDDGAAFGAPVTLEDDPTTPLFTAGDIAQSPAGIVAVAWPGKRAADGALVMHLFASANAGASFALVRDVATLGDGYGGMDNAQLALADDGQGWLTYRNNAGLQVADLSPIAPAGGTTTPGDKDGDGIPDAQDTSDASAGPTVGKTAVARVVSGDVFIRLPAGARSRQAAGTPAGYVPLRWVSQDLGSSELVLGDDAPF